MYQNYFDSRKILPLDSFNRARREGPMVPKKRTLGVKQTSRLKFSPPKPGEPAVITTSADMSVESSLDSFNSSTYEVTANAKAIISNYSLKFRSRKSDELCDFTNSISKSDCTNPAATSCDASLIMENEHNSSDEVILLQQSTFDKRMKYISKEIASLIPKSYRSSRNVNKEVSTTRPQVESDNIDFHNLQPSYLTTNVKNHVDMKPQYSSLSRNNSKQRNNSTERRLLVDFVHQYLDDIPEEMAFEESPLPQIKNKLEDTNQHNDYDGLMVKPKLLDHNNSFTKSNTFKDKSKLYLKAKKMRLLNNRKPPPHRGGPHVEVEDKDICSDSSTITDIDIELLSSIPLAPRKPYHVLCLENS